MQKQTIYKITKPIKAEIKIPGDKSVSHRSIIFGSIANGLTEVSNFLNGEDCICTQKAFEAFGVEVETLDANSLKIYGKGIKNFKAPSKDIYLGNSGTGMRLLTGFFTGLSFKTVLTGDESLSKRPMKRVIDPLSQMGAAIESQEGKAPLIINPKSQSLRLKAINYKSPVASAQVKSSILLAALHAEGITSVTEDHKSRDHLERMLEYFGADVNYDKNSNPAKAYTVSLDGDGSLNKLIGQKIYVPSDISSAAFYLVAGAILDNAELTLPKIGINPTRTGILEVFDTMKINYSIANREEISGEPVADLIVRSSEFEGITIEGDIIPRLIDEIPVIAILAAQAKGTTIIKDAEELKVKESNRIASTINMLQALGVAVQETNDGMIIEGRNKKPFEPVVATIDSFGDHRLAMSSAIAALYSSKPIEILQTEFVNTSFPGFFNIIEKIS
jgi:3-phosphoshikimate 1-carboxyvinyltransferase